MDSGGYGFSGQPYMIGTGAQPEMFIPQTNGTFVPNADRMMGNTYNITEMADNEGKPAMPPVATKIGLDSRLKSHEERTLSYDIPAKDVVLVRGEVYYQLVWTNLAEKLKQAAPADVIAPKLIALAERKVSG